MIENGFAVKLYIFLSSCNRQVVLFIIENCHFIKSTQKRWAVEEFYKMIGINDENENYRKSLIFMDTQNSQNLFIYEKVKESARLGDGEKLPPQ